MRVLTAKICQSESEGCLLSVAEVSGSDSRVKGEWQPSPLQLILTGPLVVTEVERGHWGQGAGGRKDSE